MKNNAIYFIDRFVILGILFPLFIFNTLLSNSNGQSIEFDYKNFPLKSALDSLITDKQIPVVYQDRHVEKIIISGICYDCSIESALDTLLFSQNLKWKKTGNQYIVIALPIENSQKKWILNGIVRDKLTGEPIPFANVHIQNSFWGDVTNNEGFFYIPVIKDSCILNISYIGYENKKLLLSRKDNIDKFLEIELAPKVIRSKGVTVTGQDLEFFSQPLETGQISFSPRHIASLPKLGETDIFRSLKLLPGIQIGNIGSAGLYIRGGTPDQNLIILDGMSVYQTDHFYGFFSSINSEAIKDIQIYKGGIPTKYGGMASSVIEMTGKQGNTKKRKISFYGNLLTAGLTYEEPLFDRGSIFMTYRGSYSHLYKTFLFNHIYNFLIDGEGQNSLSISTDSTDYTPSLSFYDFNGKITFMPNNQNFLSISFFSGEDDIDRLYNFSNEPYPYRIQDQSKWKNESKSIKWSKIWGNTFYSQLMISQSHYNSESYLNQFNNSNLNISIFDENSLNDFTLNLMNEWILNPSFKLEFGLMSRKYKTEYNYTAGLSKKVSNYATIKAYYFQNKWNVNPRSEIIYGLRISNFDLSDNIYWEPRISVNYRLTNYIAIKGSIDQNTQFLHRFSNDFMIGGKKFVWLLSDENLRPLSSKQINGGIQYDDKNLTSEITIFKHEITNLSDFSRLQFPSDVYNSSSDRIYYMGSSSSEGIELLFQKKTGLVRGWIGYTYGLTEFYFPDSTINNGIKYPASHDRTHEIKSVAVTSFNNWDISLSWIYSSGSVFTPRGMVGVGDIFPISIVPDTSLSMNSSRLPLIRRLDISVTKHFDLFSGTCELGFSIFNVLNRKNISHKKYITLESSDIIASDVAMLGITPTFHIRFSI